MCLSVDDCNTYRYVSTVYGGTAVLYTRQPLDQLRASCTDRVCLRDSPNFALVSLGRSWELRVLAEWNRGGGGDTPFSLVRYNYYIRSVLLLPLRYTRYPTQDIFYRNHFPWSRGMVGLWAPTNTETDSNQNPRGIQTPRISLAMLTRYIYIYTSIRYLYIYKPGIYKVTLAVSPLNSSTKAVRRPLGFWALTSRRLADRVSG